MKVYRIVCSIVILFLAGKAGFAKDIYIAQNAAGVNSGADCAAAHPASWFNTASSWGMGTAQIGPGDTVHVCGTITGSANGTVLTFQGSGLSGAPITLWFESGAVIQAPFCSGAGCIIANNRSYIVIDG